MIERSSPGAAAYNLAMAAGSGEWPVAMVLGSRTCQALCTPQAWGFLLRTAAEKTWITQSP